MSVFLPVANMVLSPWTILGVGALAGFLSGLLGVGGGFLMTPLLIILGVDPVVAAATGTNAIVAASTSGTVAHLRSGNVDRKMGAVLLVGGIIGGGAGTVLIKIMRARGSAQDLIVFCYVVLLAVMGAMMFIDGLKSRVKEEYDSQRETALFRLFQKLPFKTAFPKSGVVISPIAPLCLGTVVGLLAAIMGVGGGFFLVPAMTYALAIPIRVVVGTNLFQMLFATASVTLMQACVNHSVDAVLAFALIVGASFGAQAGARVSGLLRGDQLKLAFALLVLSLSIGMFNNLVAIPGNLLAGGGVP